LPRGLRTSINEKGVNLSGGERQRLALARGIFFAHESEIILLDEPTSSVDMATEEQIHRNIFGQFPEKTFVCVLHKLYLLPHFDYAYVFENGKIVKEGTPEEINAPSMGAARYFEHAGAAA
jgi:ABC-type bacteriocin/lantibiotic exporter with double-glycine peptidase domain